MNADESGHAGAPSAQPFFCGDIDIRIAADGVWFHEGCPIGRKPLVKLFASVLERDDAGDYWLITPVERARITVDDAPFVAVELAVEGTGRSQTLRFRTNIDEWIEAGPDHPLSLRPRPTSGELAPYLLVRGGLEALIGRTVYYELVGLCVEEAREDGTALGVWSGGAFFAFGDPASAEATA